jgi:hypothetical protein
MRLTDGRHFPPRIFSERTAKWHTVPYWQARTSSITMADDGGWGDLFAKAAGEEPEASSQNENLEDDSSEKVRKEGQKSKKRKRKVISGDHLGDAYENSYASLLEDRMNLVDPYKTWPCWLDLDRSLIDTESCQKWNASEKRKYAKCRNCEKSALYHRVKVEKSWEGERHNSWPFLAFTLLRNLRCCAKIAATCAAKDYKFLTKGLRGDQSELFPLISIFRSQLSPEEASLLESKFEKVVECCSDLTKNLYDFKRLESQSKKDSLHYFEQAIRLIIACDAVYYRLYYLQMTKVLPGIRNDNVVSFLPHPLEYFGLNFLVMDPDHSYRSKEKLLASIEDDIDDHLESDPLFAELRQVHDSHSLTRKESQNGKDHVLSAIHRYRLLETISLFHHSGWSSSAKTQKRAVSSLTKDIEVHETVAPALLMEWRDSCRDFLCNLYAYATLASGSVERIADTLKKYQIDGGVLEIGAGTGYVAKLLRTAGIQVDAWDIHPTDNTAMNEYHGFTPPFLDVYKSAKFPVSSNAANIALLLCYPPPDSPMAYDTLTAYLQAGGTCVVHIGEFKGLTGDGRFERLLTKRLSCRNDRFPCLSWGADASHVTVWAKPEKDRKERTESKLLLPCTSCNQSEATSRCRLVRSIVYCSQRCFKEDAVGRTCRLKMAMIEIDNKILDFQDKQHFSAL